MRVDLTRIYEPGQKSLPYTVSFPGDVKNSAIEVVKRNPDNISLTVVKWEEKQIPVVGKLTGTLPENYVSDKQNMTLGHESIQISGPKDVIDQIDQAQIRVDMTGRTESVAANFPITLCDSSGNPVTDVSAVTVNVGQVWMNVPVLLVKEVALEMPIIAGGGLTADDVELLTINGVDIRNDRYVISIIGSPTNVQKVPDVIQLGVIDLSKEIEDFQNREYAIKLPEGVRNLSTGLDTVPVSLDIPDMDTHEVSVPLSQFQITEPEGYRIRIRLVSMQVVVQGRVHFINEFKNIDEKEQIKYIQAVLDLSDATENGYYPVQFSVVGFENIGVIPAPNTANKYEVYVSVEPDSAGG